MESLRLGSSIGGWHRCGPHFLWRGGRSEGGRQGGRWLQYKNPMILQIVIKWLQERLERGVQTPCIRMKANGTWTCTVTNLPSNYPLHRLLGTFVRKALTLHKHENIHRASFPTISSAELGNVAQTLIPEVTSLRPGLLSTCVTVRMGPESTRRCLSVQLKSH